MIEKCQDRYRNVRGVIGNGQNNIEQYREKIRKRGRQDR